MQDRGGSCSIIQHHNRATIEGEIATGMLELLYIEWGGYMSKSSHFSTVAWDSVHFYISGQIVNTRGIFIFGKTLPRVEKIGVIHKSWFLDMSVILNWIAVVLYVFQTQTVS